MAYEFRKIYADCVADDGEVLVSYLNEVRLGGTWSVRASVERYAPDGSRALVHGADAPAVVDGYTAVEDLPLTVVSPDARYHLALTPRLGAWDPPTPPPVDALTWGDRVVHGTGYVDYVRIVRPTRWLGLRTLRWGRVHLPDRTVVFEHLDMVDGQTWDTGFEWAIGGVPRPLSAAVFGGDGAGYVDLSDGRLSLAPLRVLHDGNAFDAERVPSRIDRWACEILGGPTHETRWLGVARHGTTQVTALWERVRFDG